MSKIQERIDAAKNEASDQNLGASDSSKELEVKNILNKLPIGKNSCRC